MIPNYKTSCKKVLLDWLNPIANAYDYCCFCKLLTHYYDGQEVASLGCFRCQWTVHYYTTTEKIKHCTVRNINVVYANQGSIALVPQGLSQIGKGHKIDFQTLYNKCNVLGLLHKK